MTAALILRMGAGVRTLEVPEANRSINLMPLYTERPEGRPKTEGEARAMDAKRRDLKGQLREVIEAAKEGLRRRGWFRSDTAEVMTTTRLSPEHRRKVRRNQEQRRHRARRDSRRAAA